MEKGCPPIFIYIYIWCLVTTEAIFGRASPPVCVIRLDVFWTNRGPTVYTKPPPSGWWFFMRSQYFLSEIQSEGLPIGDSNLISYSNSFSKTFGCWLEPWPSEWQNAMLTTRLSPAPSWHSSASTLARLYGANWQKVFVAVPDVGIRGKKDVYSAWMIWWRGQSRRRLQLQLDIGWVCTLKENGNL